MTMDSDMRLSFNAFSIAARTALRATL
jgi:hypothetical protein